MATHHLNAGAVSTAQQWLAWSARFASDHGRTELMQASCFRRLERMDRWRKALQLAEQKGAPARQVQQEHQLMLIQSGQLGKGAEAELLVLIDAGVSPHEVSAAFVRGYLAGENPEKARALLDAWAADFPEEPQVAYMRGIHRRWLGERTAAETEFQNALARQPRHELARTALAQMFEEQHRLDEAVRQYVELATRFPTNSRAREGRARLLRKLGRLGEARAVLEPLALQSEPRFDVVMEMGQIEFASGEYEEAERWFNQVDLDQTADSNVLAAVASALALGGQTSGGERLFAQIDAAHDTVTRAYDLAVRLALDPADREAAEESQRLYEASIRPLDGSSPGIQSVQEDRRGELATSGPELYSLHCSACHAATGDGNGRAARHLFPRPRDIRTGKSRLVSTLNGVPTLRDVEAAIRRGMPGTSMQSFDNLGEEQRRMLAQEVLRLNEEGIREHFISQLRSEEEPIDENEVRQVIEICTTPGEVADVPQIGPVDSQAIARGKEAYGKLGCDKCHGDDGAGANDTPLFDDKGRPTIPRDLAYEPFKGGQEPESVYLRIYLGMPGTPHPACYGVSADRCRDLVHYCRSLSREPKRTLTNHQRATRAAQRTSSAVFGRSHTP